MVKEKPFFTSLQLFLLIDLNKTNIFMNLRNDSLISQNGATLVNCRCKG